ncbi:MAG: tetratricopeptide repeat protein, partial [Candidatus Omnitrophica bacterium]|nr:tetratricopeptide repeat protein [Candidatus Omnitrophota bacterium]
PTDLQPYFEKGIQAYTQGSYEYAVDLLTFVIRQAPDATEARRYLRLAIQKQFAANPPSVVSQLGLGLVTLPVRCWAVLTELQGKHRQATNLYEWLLHLLPRSRPLLMRMATTLTRGGLDDAAVQTYEELLAVDPNHLGCLRKLARLAMKRSNDPQARQCFERILHLHPGDLEAQQSLRNLDALGTIKKGFAT